MRRETAEGEAITGERAHKERGPVFRPRGQAIRVCDVLLGEMLLVPADGNVGAAVGDDAALIEGILVGMAQGNEFVVALEVGDGKSGDPAHGFEGWVAGPFGRSAHGAN